jgi:hypothetical protein
MSANHSPGPWKRDGHRTIVDANGVPVCEVFSGGCGIKQADINELLIENTPEMLAVLRMASQIVADHGTFEQAGQIFKVLKKLTGVPA